MARGNAYCHSIMRLEKVDTEPAEDKLEIYAQIDHV